MNFAHAEPGALAGLAAASGAMPLCGQVLVVLNWLMPLLYLALLADYAATFFLRTRVSGPWRSVTAVLLAHLGFLALRTMHMGQLPLATSPDILSVVALCTGAVYWLMERAGRDRRAGAFVLLLVFALQYSSSVFLNSSAGAHLGRNVGGMWDRLHVVPAVLAYTSLMLGGILGALDLAVERNLKRHRFGLLFDRLPPVELLGRMIWCAALVGLVFLTICIVTGGPLVAAHDQASETDEWQLKMMFKVGLGGAAWVICLVAVLGRALRRWPMRRVSAAMIIEALIILLLMMSSAVLS